MKPLSNTIHMKWDLKNNLLYLFYKENNDRKEEKNDEHALYPKNKRNTN